MVAVQVAPLYYIRRPLLAGRRGIGNNTSNSRGRRDHFFSSHLLVFPSVPKHPSPFPFPPPLSLPVFLDALTPGNSTQPRGEKYTLEVVIKIDTKGIAILSVKLSDSLCSGATQEGGRYSGWVGERKPPNINRMKLLNIRITVSSYHNKGEKKWIIQQA